MQLRHSQGLHETAPFMQHVHKHECAQCAQEALLEEQCATHATALRAAAIDEEVAQVST